MHFDNQQVIPAARTVKQFDEIIASPFDYIVLLEVHISLLMSLKREAHRHGKKINYSCGFNSWFKKQIILQRTFLCNDIRPAGIISTRSNMLMKAKARGIMAIQRVFLIDTIALEKKLFDD
ncbi:glycerol-3-phosphate responsive antiterminator [Lysinibacillus sp. MHQ-1]|nr:glycerol-3-phosphate responsive antiterminator [Lysinibacillus sp. MHQ-1]